MVTQPRNREAARKGQGSSGPAGADANWPARQVPCGPRDPPVRLVAAASRSPIGSRRRGKVHPWYFAWQAVIAETSVPAFATQEASFCALDSVLVAAFEADVACAAADAGRPDD